MTTVLEDALSRFAPLAALADEPGPVRVIRGTVLAVALEWLKLPDGEHKTLALWHLEKAGEAACDALKA